MRHGEVEHQITAPSGVLQVVEDLHVTAFLPILGAGRDWCLRTQVRLALGPPLGNRTQNARVGCARAVPPTHQGIWRMYECLCYVIHIVVVVVFITFTK